MIWDVAADSVDWRDGAAVASGALAGKLDPLPLAALALKAGRTGGPISAEVVAQRPGGGAGLRDAYLRCRG